MLGTTNGFTVFDCFHTFWVFLFGPIVEFFVQRMNTFRKTYQNSSLTTSINGANILSKTEHRKGAVGYRQGADRAPNYAHLYQTGPGCMSAASGRHPYGLLKGALRLQILSIYRASPDLRWICTHKCRRIEIRKGPRISTASRQVLKSCGVRWICESPFT